MPLIFPSSPEVGQLFVADNTVTYVWTGNRWNAAIPIHNGTAVYTSEGGYSIFDYVQGLDNQIDPGGA